MASGGLEMEFRREHVAGDVRIPLDHVRSVGVVDHNGARLWHQRVGEGEDEPVRRQLHGLAHLRRATDQLGVCVRGRWRGHDRCRAATTAAARRRRTDPRAAGSGVRRGRPARTSRPPCPFEVPVRRTLDPHAPGPGLGRTLNDSGRRSGVQQLAGIGANLGPAPGPPERPGRADQAAACGARARSGTGFLQGPVGQYRAHDTCQRREAAAGGPAAARRRDRRSGVPGRLAGRWGTSAERARGATGRRAGGRVGTPHLKSARGPHRRPHRWFAPRRRRAGPGTQRRRPRPTGPTRCAFSGPVGGGAWAVLMVVQLVLTISDTVGVPLRRGHAWLVRGMATTGPVLALALAASVIVLVGIGAARVTTVRGTRILLALALVALVPTAVTGHTTSASDAGRRRAAGLVVHVVGAAIWTRGVSPDCPAPAWLPGSPVGRGPPVQRAGSGCLRRPGRLGSADRHHPDGHSPTRWASGYGGIIAAKVVILVALGVLGWVHRRRTMAALADGRGLPFLRVAGIELVLMGSAIGLAAALARRRRPPRRNRPTAPGTRRCRRRSTRSRSRSSRPLAGERPGTPGPRRCGRCVLSRRSCPRSTRAPLAGLP